MILQKQFIFDQSKEFQVVNYNDVRHYIEQKIKHFQIYENWKSKQEHLKLYQEIVDMANEDVVNPNVDLSGISNIPFYEKVDIGNAIRYYDLVYILGAISYGVFDYDKNALNHTEDGEHGAVNLSDMVQYAYDELHNAKLYSNIRTAPVYGTTLTCTTVIESELKRKLKYLVLQDLIDAVETNILNGTYAPSKDEQLLFDCLRGKRNNFNFIYVTTKGADHLFTCSGVYSPDKKVKNDQRNLIKNKMTLNPLIHSSLFIDKAEPSFCKLVGMLFEGDKLNLRNSIAHAGLEYENYYHTSAAALLYLILIAVVKDYWRK